MRVQAVASLVYTWQRARRVRLTSGWCLSIILFSACEQAPPRAADDVGSQRQALSLPQAKPIKQPVADARVSWVVMKEQADLTPARVETDPIARTTRVLDALRSTAQRSQADVQALLTKNGQDYRSFWIRNALRVEADAATLQQLKQHPDVADVVADRVLKIPDVQRSQEDVAAVSGVEWGIDSIRAPEVWADFGARGDGVVIASIDSGAVFDHPALRRQYRGYHGGAYDHNYNWYDPMLVCGSPSLAPCDNSGHGSHTLGTMVGDDGDPGENRIGVAPHATWISAKGCETIYCSYTALMAAAQWILAPTDLNGQNPRPDLRPDIVNNSWASVGGDGFFRGVVTAWVNAGIFPVFAAGNSGSACGSAVSPGDYPESYAAGAYDVSLSTADFSSRGPSLFGVFKPNIAAPGVSVRSSVPGADPYAWYNGTSMAAPHVAGSAALMLSASPGLIGDPAAIRRLLDQGAIDFDATVCGGTATNNNVWGEGRLDVYHSVELSTRSPSGIQGVIRDGATQAPLTQVEVRVHGSARDRVVTTDPRGAFQLRLDPGTYTMSVSMFGYTIQPDTELTIDKDKTNNQEIALTPLPSHVIAGTVRDDDGQPVQGVTVTLLRTPIAPAITDAAGSYRIDHVPDGVYDLEIEGSGCFEPLLETLTVQGDQDLQRQLAKHTDAYGYRCTNVSREYVAAEQELLHSGDDETAAISLPFPFVFYGVSYDRVYAGINGIIELGADRERGTNTPIPSAAPPNAAIYVDWDDLYLDAQSSVRTQVLGNAPLRRVVVEWRDMLSYDLPNERRSFEVSLYEDNQILMQYAGARGDPWRGSTATIGIEDATGSQGLQYSFDSASIAPGSALLFAVPQSTVVRGVVTDAGDQRPIAGAQVAAKQADQIVRATSTNERGEYLLQVPTGSVTLDVSNGNYTEKQVALELTDGQALSHDIALDAPQAKLSTNTLSLVLTSGQQRHRQLTLHNTGTMDFKWSLHEAASQLAFEHVPERLDPAANAAGQATRQPQASDTRQLFGTIAAVSSNSTVPGGVLRAFTASNLGAPWGVGYDGSVWLSDWNGGNTQFLVDGMGTGINWPTPWVGGNPGDMAFDSLHKLMCQVNIYGDNGIYCWERSTGQVVSSIRGELPWTRVTQRGLAYREDDDTFYVGSWDSQVIYHIRGLSHAQPGEVLGSCVPSDASISGLAWNPSMHVLWEATNSPSDNIYELSPEDCSVLGIVPHPEPGFNGAGLEMDVFGNLWTLSQASKTAYLLDSQVPSYADLPWLSVVQATGLLAPGDSQAFDVNIDTTGLQPGVYLGALDLESNAGRTPRLRVPVSLIVTDYQRAIDAGSGKAYIDHNGDTWAADHRYSEGDYGYMQSSRSFTTSHEIAGTSDPALYQSERIDPYAYRFDAVPNGSYQVELRFAQLRDQPLGQRYFDVIAEDQTILPAHDIAYEVGSFTADDHTFFVDVFDGALDLRFVARDGVPVISALRVSRRPDR